MTLPTTSALGRDAVPSSDTVRVCTGLAIISVGAPLAWIVRDAVHGGTSPVFSAILLLFGVTLILRFTSLRQGLIYANKSEFGIVLAPILFITGFALVSSAPPETGGGTIDVAQLATDIVLIGLVIAGFSQPLSAFRHVHRAVAIVGCFVAVASLLYAISSVGTLVEFVAAGRFGGFGDIANDSDSSPVTIARVASMTLAGAWIWYREKDDASMTASLTLILAIVSAGSMFLLARSRTNMIGAVVLFVLLISIALTRMRFSAVVKRRRKPGWTRTKIAFASMVIVGTVMASSFVIENFSGPIDTAFNFLFAGGASFAGGGQYKQGEEDESAVERKAFLSRALTTLQLTGHGYKGMFIDDPVLESFYDFGILGGVLYLLVTIIIPFKISLDLALRAFMPPSVKFAIASYVLQMPLLFLSTTPYQGINWYFIVAFYVIAGRCWTLEYERVEHSQMAPR